VSIPQIVRAVVAVLREWLELLRHRSLLFLTLSYTAVGYFEYLFFFWMPNYFKDELHFGDAESRFYGTFPPIAMAIGMLLGGWLSDRIARLHGYRLGRVIVPASGMLLAVVLLACGIIAANTSASPPMIVTLFSLSLGAMGAVEAPTWAAAIHLGGRRGSTAAGICNTGGNAGGTLAPTVTPWVGATLGWNYALGLSCLVCLAGVVLWFWIDPSRALDESPPSDDSTPKLAPSASA
jgi:ACS family D-galactonate transporter-like MFS transporter